MKLDKDYLSITMMVIITAIGVVAADYFAGKQVAAGVAMLGAFVAAGKCLIIIKRLDTNNHMGMAINAVPDDFSRKPLGRMSQFP